MLTLVGLESCRRLRSTVSGSYEAVLLVIRPPLLLAGLDCSVGVGDPSELAIPDTEDLPLLGTASPLAVRQLLGRLG